MFDFDAGKLLIVGVIALVFIPPKDLPRVLRELGQFVGRMRRMATDFQSQFMDAMREADMADVRREARKLADSARVDVGFDPVHDLDRQMVAKLPAETAHGDAPAGVSPQTSGGTLPPASEATEQSGHKPALSVSAPAHPV